MEVQTHTFLTSTLDYRPRDKSPLCLLNGMLGRPQRQSERFRVRRRAPAWNQWRTEGGLGCQPPPPPKFWWPSKIVANSPRLWKLLKIAVFRTPTPKDVRKKGSKILKLPPVRNCFTLAMTNKLVGIINNFKVPKIKKILLYEMKFLVPNYNCLQNPWLGSYRPQIPVLSVLCPQLISLNPPTEQKSRVRHGLEQVLHNSVKHSVLHGYVSHVQES